MRQSAQLGNSPDCTLNVRYLSNVVEPITVSIAFGLKLAVLLNKNELGDLKLDFTDGSVVRP